MSAAKAHKPQMYRTRSACLLWLLTLNASRVAACRHAVLPACIIGDVARHGGSGERSEPAHIWKPHKRAAKRVMSPAVVVKRLAVNDAHRQDEKHARGCGRVAFGCQQPKHTSRKCIAHARLVCFGC